MPAQTTRPQLAYLADQMNDLKQKGTHFSLRVLEDEQAPECTFDGKKVIFGEGCRLSRERLKRAGIRFKQVPYQIKVS